MCPYLAQQIAAMAFEFPAGGVCFSYAPSDWTPLRIVPKNNNLLRARPLGDQSVRPIALLCRVAAQCVELCVATIPAEWHFDRTNHQEVMALLRNLVQYPLTHSSDDSLRALVNSALYIVSDVENGFMNIEHSEIVLV